jgi:hypothetical protein
LKKENIHQFLGLGIKAESNLYKEETVVANFDQVEAEDRLRRKVKTENEQI